MTNKLTDEQREVIESILKDASSGDCQKNESAQFVMSYSASQLIPTLYASEQAWKEEAERSKGAVEDMFQNREKWRLAYEDLTNQLNQAIEVLKWINSSDFYNPISVPEIKVRAAGILSSLQEDKT